MLDVKLQLVQGAVILHTGRPTSLAPSLFNQKRGIGSSMGPQSSSGTLGPYLKIGSSEDKKVLALSRYQCHSPR